MRIGVSVYFPMSFGGGERYLLTAAEALRSVGDVDVLSPNVADLTEFEERFGLDLSGVRAIPRSRGALTRALDWMRPKAYDLFFALDNHLAPVQISLGRRGILHLQTPPYAPDAARPRRAARKLASYDRVVVNSEYTKRWALRHGTGGLPVEVLYPPIECGLYSPLEKTRTILSVGRFFVGRHEKRHGVLIDAFRRLCDEGLDGWELVLAGSVRDWEPEHLRHLEELRERAADLPVRFLVNASLEEMQQAYGGASLYWHATGFGVVEEEHPQFLEHFGMAIVEAMSAGAIPLAVGSGGPLEIIEDGSDGAFWHSVDELVERTRELAAAGPSQSSARRERCIARARRFSKERFVEGIRALAVAGA